MTSVKCWEYYKAEIKYFHFTLNLVWAFTSVLEAVHSIHHELLLVAGGARCGDRRTVLKFDGGNQRVLCGGENFCFNPAMFLTI